MSSAMDFGKGLIAGAVIGAGVTMAIDPIKDKQHKAMKKKANGMFKNIGQVMDNLISMK